MIPNVPMCGIYLDHFYDLNFISIVIPANQITYKNKMKHAVNQNKTYKLSKIVGQHPKMPQKQQ